MSISPSRRTFVKQMTLGLGTAGLALPLTTACASNDTPDVEPAALTSAPQQDGRLGIALVGLGYYSTDILAPALQETENCYLAGIVTGTPEKATAWKDQYDIPEANVYNYETFDQIADNEAIDIIYVVLPNAMHREYVVRAAQAGKHVICEKPMALTVEDCRAMIDACEDAGVSLSIGYRMHYEPYTQEVMRLGQEQVFGPVKLVAAGAGYRETRPNHWKVGRELGGGAMYDMGVYSLQAARYVTGEEPVTVSAQTFTTRPEMFDEVDETTLFQLRFPSGAVANLHTSFGVNMNYMHANAERGWFKLHPFSSYRGIQGQTSEGVLSFPDINQQAAQMDHTARAIMNGTPVLVSGEEGLRDIRVVEGVYRAIETGGTVELPPLG